MIHVESMHKIGPVILLSVLDFFNYFILNFILL